ncbi:hypothetical protein CLV76_1165 [Marivita geojedonensis]|nr:hypothetical protein CLV76_1165 [Marivita geojedonensis]
MFVSLFPTKQRVTRATHVHDPELSLPKGFALATATLAYRVVYTGLSSKTFNEQSHRDETRVSANATGEG